MTTILWILVLGIPIALVLSYYFIGLIRIILERRKSKPKTQKPRFYPIERLHQLDYDYGEESTAEIDFQDEED
jgi:hypothetical protein